MTTESNHQEQAVYTLEGDALVPSDLAQGPWNPEHQSGGAVSGILARSAERVETPCPMRIARLSIDLMRPVPMKPLIPQARVVRAGRRIQVVDVWLEDAGQTVARASVLRVRTDDSLNPGAEYTFNLPSPPRPEAGKDGPVTRRKLAYMPGWMRAIDFRREQLSQPGQKNRAWVRLRKDLVADEPNSPITRLAALGDFSAGIANALDLSRWTSPNADLSLHILREPQSEWLALEASASISPDGLGQSSAIIFDDQGICARGHASLIVDRWPDA